MREDSPNGRIGKLDLAKLELIWLLSWIAQDLHEKTDVLCQRCVRLGRAGCALAKSRAKEHGTQAVQFYNRAPVESTGYVPLRG